MTQIHIFRKIQLFTLIAIISGISILVYGDFAFAFEPIISSEDIEKCLDGHLSEYGWCKDYRIEQMTIEEPINPDPDFTCPPGTYLSEGICQIVKAEKTKIYGDDAPFFDIFVYFDDLFSWLFGITYF